MTWNDITLKQYLEIQDALTIEDEFDKLTALYRIVFNKDLTKVPLTELNNESEKLMFIGEPLPKPKEVKKFSVNGHDYKVSYSLDNFSTGQYIDFIEFAKQNNMPRALATIILPADKKNYGEGYDVDDIVDDINNISVVLMGNLFFSFLKRFKKFINRLKTYFMMMTLKTKLPLKEKWKTIKLINQQMDLINMGLSTL